MSKYLGIDYGTVHVGVAVAELTLATPLLSLTNDERLLDNLAKVVVQEQIELIVCGIPEGKLAGDVALFAKKLEAKVDKKVILHPETLSTQEAITLLRQGGASRKKLHNDHAYAACLILEDYLELNNGVN